MLSEYKSAQQHTAYTSGHALETRWGAQAAPVACSVSGDGGRERCWRRQSLPGSPAHRRRASPALLPRAARLPPSQGAMSVATVTSQ